MKEVLGDDPYKKITIFFLFFVSAIIMVLGNNNLSSECPDENMRYQLVEYLYEHGKLPHGGDTEIQTAWGFSYAFLPYLSAIISAIFMKITSCFTNSADSLLIAARMVSVFWGCGAVIYVFKLADKLFQSAFKWIFISTIVFLPQFVYISSYLNNDIAGLMAVCMIAYYWLEGSEKNWNKQSIIGLSIGLSICILSYYNDYGFVLMSIVYYFIDQIKKKTSVKEILKDAGYISALCFCMAGWFFIHNAYLYNGDFLGLNTLMEYKNTYAIPEVLAQLTVQEQGFSVFYMLFNMQWILITGRSFIAIFGSMNIGVSNSIYAYYSLLFVIGTILYIVHLTKNRKSKKNYLFESCLFVGGMIAIILSIYNSYTNDFQAQGRYIITFLVFLSFAITKGIEGFIGGKNTKISRSIIGGICGINAIVLLYCCITIFL